jgi:DNA-binding beta-propeller fold protein YncE
MRFSSRLLFILVLVIPAIVVIAAAGRRLSEVKPDRVWGRRGVLDGEFVRPRAATLVGEHLYIVDFTARIQAFTLEGQHTGITFTTPDFRNGRPSGLGTDRDGNLLVADSHYHSVRIYRPSGELIRVLTGDFGYVSDCVQDADGSYFISEFGRVDRITKLDADGQFVKAWGENGTADGQFQRVRALAIGPDGLLYCADACNHRIQVFTRNGEHVRTLGGPGGQPGEFALPYDVAFGPDGSLYVVERGNSRVQKLTTDGKPLGEWGLPGRGPGQLADPWAIVVDGRGRVHVIDTENHRVQRVRL